MNENFGHLSNIVVTYLRSHLSISEVTKGSS